MGELNIREILEKLIVVIPVIIPALVIHEYAHAWVAYRCGDTTAKDQGRLTLDPMVHMDPMGAIFIVLMLITPVKFIFGWAKPVPVNFGNLRNPLRDMAFVAAAGPVSNMLQVGVWYGLLWVLHLSLGTSNNTMVELFYQFAIYGILINLALAFFNLLPIPPLDGSRIVVAFSPPNIGRAMAQLEPYGFMVLMLLLWTGIIDVLLTPVSAIFHTLMSPIIG
ncbi:MAG: hypothetical protein AUJ92_18575 [Armatimonadetes bacterium CG2_30_59_28]|nr:site-2 protease family protein [Armatimonadota bacterium]OIO90522.1 MAG: hypothetical protein AUJ92_18575 [Armatimonadetes bacterium CG2_30_59_28]PIU64727.1 MAG: site-2 protease family protein [Armatimonadetes bacterium CG07_land_8_20_14_0_80_59_28]PIX39483.1 MAG: site-2 protease family protein [Armatimonadetes bacterium CG_4_8_14_3_um_filter_58_9]PIY40554.1 MAG: site-2 protease family protein [Armatimonadetes bacterium CG_4_10_14_3_um_filter_59_10]PJB73417.1 MAG: site-2 protease family pro